MLLTRCCCCIPLRAGCIVIGVLIILYAIVLIWFDIDTLNNLGDEKNDDEENLKQKQHVRTLTCITVIDNIANIVFGGVIIYVAWRMLVMPLKVCSIILVIKTLVPILFYIFQLPYYKVFNAVLCTLFNFYFAYVLWSYANELEADYPDVIAIPPLEMYPMHRSGNGQGITVDQRLPPPYGWAPGRGTPGYQGHPFAPSGPPRTAPGTPGYEGHPVLPSGPLTRSTTPSRYPGPPEVHQYPGPPSAPPEYSSIPPYATPSSTHVQSPRTPVQPM